MKPSIFLLLFTLVFTACQEAESIDMSQLSAEEKKAVESLLWLKDTNPDKHAAGALHVLGFSRLAAPL